MTMLTEATASRLIQSLPRAPAVDRGLTEALTRISKIRIERGMDADEAIERGISAVGQARAALALSATPVAPEPAWRTLTDAEIADIGHTTLRETPKWAGGQVEFNQRFARAILAAAAEPVAPGGVPSELTFAAFRSANAARCVKWHPEGIESWSASDWMTAIVGELGELASLIKMRNRERDGLPGNKFSPTDKQVADEAADVLTYLDLFCAMHGIDLGAAAVAKFNEVSERVGFPDRITLCAEAAGRRAAVERPASLEDSYDWLKAETLLDADCEMCERWEADGIDAALKRFAEDMTRDNAVGVVAAVADAFRRLSNDRIPAPRASAPTMMPHEMSYIKGWNDYREALKDLVFDHRLTAPAQVANVSFGVGVSIGTVIQAAQREYEFRHLPAVEAERIEKGREALRRFQESPEDGDDIQF